MHTAWNQPLPAALPPAAAMAMPDFLAADVAIAERIDAAAAGDRDACFDLGVACSTGDNGMACDLVEAHKWFNLAALAGHDEASLCRADIAGEMTAREIAEAQRRARQWLAATTRKAA